MFDNPQKQLKQLEDQLLAAEHNKDEKFERLYAELLRDYGPEQEESSDEIVYRNYANSYGRDVQKPANPQAAPSQNSAPVESYTDGRMDPVVPNRSNKALIIIICVELLGIGFLAAWWALRIMTVL